MPTSKRRSLVWFRRDLRVHDNTALANACRANDREIVAIYFVTPQQWQQHDDADHKVAFTLGCLQELSANLAEKNIPLLIETCADFSQVPHKLKAVCDQYGIDQVFLNCEYEVNEQRRDQSVVDLLDESGIPVFTYHDRVLVPPEDIKTKQNAFYSVFTPYRKVWDKRIEQDRTETNPSYVCVNKAPRKRAAMPDGVPPTNIPDHVEGFDQTDCWTTRFPPGESSGLKKLASFADRVFKYDTDRDLPSIQDGTSGLSAYLAAGAISPRQCLQMIQEAESETKDSEGARVWISELTWRDFYTHVMIGFPRVSMHLPFKLATNQLDWRTSETEFSAWCSGQTGFPIVDAGMRQLNQIGWMHNRLRMVTAMFLTKNLLIDWRMGERYFMKQLIDGDLAANNGGWQWSASTGTDAVPYFRIFNPFSQSKRFDRDGRFIKSMCPELQSVPATALHDPAKLTTEIKKRGIDYPDYIVDYKHSRERALAAFKALSGKS